MFKYEASALEISILFTLEFSHHHCFYAYRHMPLGDGDGDEFHRQVAYHLAHLYAVILKL